MGRRKQIFCRYGHELVDPNVIYGKHGRCCRRCQYDRANERNNPERYFCKERARYNSEWQQQTRER